MQSNSKCLRYSYRMLCSPKKKREQQMETGKKEIANVKRTAVWGEA